MFVDTPVYRKIILQTIGNSGVVLLQICALFVLGKND
jgi:hypothetical protein